MPPPSNPTPNAGRLRLSSFLLTYLVLATAVAVRQAGYFNADFVAYASLAHRLLENPSSSISGYWSPLFSWCMAPLIGLGLDDMAAGRIVLIAAGLAYVMAIHQLARRLAGASANDRRFVVAAADTCAVLQAAGWATYLLDPDLLASALILLYLGQVFDPHFAGRAGRGFVAGLLAGAAYLAKAYMLPFVLAHLALSPWLFRRTLRSWLVSYASVLLGLAIIAGPWIGVLSAHYGRATYSTAAATNHANVAPGLGRSDPLWNPGLQRDFILDPHYGPDWSPLHSRAELFHQAGLVIHNAGNVIGFVVGALALLIIGAASSLAGVKQNTPPPAAAARCRGAAALLLTAILYCAGYTLINAESRYIVPVVAPLLCLAGILLLGRVLVGDASSGLGNSPARQLVLGILVVLPFSAVEIYSLVRIALRHPQMNAIAPYRDLTDRLERNGLLDQPFAAWDWHIGLNLAYAAHREAQFVGAPSASDPSGRAAQLNAAGVKMYFSAAYDRTSSAPLPAASGWSRRMSAPFYEFTVEVYVQK